jgi:3'(2'), 5'-bisphosphate nucleotidase
VSCLVGICVDEEAFAGVLVQPFSGAAWWGAVGVGARRRGARDGEWCVVDFARHHVAEQGLRSVVVSSSRPDGPVSQCVARMQAALPGLSVSQAGGCGHKLLIVAEGGADLYVFPCGGTSLWDVAAGDALFRAAGGLVLDRLGNQIRYRASAASWDNTLGIVAGRDPQAVRWCVEGFASKI